MQPRPFCLSNGLIGSLGGLNPRFYKWGREKQEKEECEDMLILFRLMLSMKVLFNNNELIYKSIETGYLG
jgi:hypothetical protein